MRRVIVSIALAASALLAQPVGAQESIEDEMMAAMMEMFAVEPLTPEQEARLPQAAEIVEKMVPPGTMAEVMGSMFDGILAPFMGMASQVSAEDAAGLLGYTNDELGLSEEDAAEIVALVDPALQERTERLNEAMPEIMGAMMTTLEPAMKTAMSEIYAIYFDEGELTDIDTFFSTETGGAFARKTMTMSTDPRLIAGMMQSLPELLGSFAQMEEQIAAITADLPQALSFADLGSAERARLAELTGLGEAAIKAGMARAAAAEMQGDDELQ